MTEKTIFPLYLESALGRLDTAKTIHLENAGKLDETETAISRAREQKAELEQENGSSGSAWRDAFRAGGAVLTDELKNSHIERVARRELAQECDNLAEVLEYERDRLRGSCDGTARAYRQAHLDVLMQYAGHELEEALKKTCGALVRAMKLKILALDNPLANTTGHQGYVAPETAVMQEVKAWLEQQVSAHHIRLADEPVLYKTGLSSASLPHMEYGLADSPGKRKAYQEKLRQRGADLKARGLLS